MSKILLVEDDTNLSEIYQARLEAEGYVVVAAPDGETALALAAKEKPDLILSDVMMPKISGFEMLDILRNTEGLRHTKVIMLTALGQAEDKTRAEQLGADRYLVKSQVTLEDIVKAAQELLTDELLPSSAELAAPTDNSSTAVSAPPASDAAAEPVATDPAQPAPTGPLEPTAAADTTPPVVAMPVAAPPTSPAQETNPEPAAVTDAPAPEPVAPLPAPAATDTPEPATSDAEPKIQEAQEVQEAEDTPETEEATTTTQAADVVQEQIAQFEKDAGTTPPAAVTPEATPATEEASTSDSAPAPDPNNPAVIDENIVASAIDKLLAKTPGGAESVDAPTPGAAISPSSSSERPHKKVISPIDRPQAPSLDELIAKEEAKDKDNAGAITFGPEPDTEADAETEDADADANEAETAAEDSDSDSDKPKKAFDPNSVAL